MLTLSESALKRFFVRFLLCTSFALLVVESSTYSYGEPPFTPGTKRPGEDFDGDGTYGKTAWYQYIDPATGDGFYIERGQTVTSNQTQAVNSSSSQMIEKVCDLKVVGNQTQEKRWRGTKVELFQSSATVNTQNGRVRILDRINYEYAYIKSFPNANGSDAFRWVTGKIESTAQKAADSLSGSLTLHAYREGEEQVPADQLSSMRGNVEFDFSYDFTVYNGIGTWSYDYTDWVRWAQFPIYPSANQSQTGDWDMYSIGTSVHDGFFVPGIGPSVSGLGIDWLYSVTDAWDFVAGLASHPSQYSYGFPSMSRSYIFEHWPIST